MPGNNLCLLSVGQGGVVGRGVLRHRTVLWRNRWRRDRSGPAAQCTPERICPLCRNSAGRIRRLRCICCRTDHLFYSDEHHLVRIQSQVIGTIHTVFCRSVVCSVHNLRNTTIRNEHESRANVCARTLCHRLARALDLFHRADVWHAGRRRAILTKSQRGRSLLCKTPPRQ